MTTDNTGYNGTTGSSGQTGLFGMKMSAVNTCQATSCVKSGDCTATIAYIYNAAHDTVLGQANFSGNTATFSPAISLTASTTYYLVADKGGASYTFSQDNSSISYPTSGTNINFTTGIGSGWSEDGTAAQNFISIDTIVSVNYTATPSALALTTSIPASNDVVIHLASALAMVDTLNAPTLDVVDAGGIEGQSLIPYVY